MSKAGTVGTVLACIGALGLVVGIAPLVMVVIVDPKSTAMGPGLLMVVTVPPSVLMLLVGLVLRGKKRKEPEEGAIVSGSFWRGGAVRHERHDRAA
jgi:peptidoglycan/LPS O-acetylase OafA/YrhL